MSACVLKFCGRIFILTSLFGVAAASAAAPVNDAFASAAVLGSLATVTTAGTTVESTREASEPIYAGGEQSVWFKWTAPSSGWKKLTASSTETTINNQPVLAVYEGGDLGSLVAVGVDEPGAPLARFNAVAAHVYYFQVLESNTPGAFSIALTNGTAPAAPANDNFSSPTTVAASLPRTGVAGTFIDATLELREPNVYIGSGRASVWYKWTPAASALVDIYILSSASTRFRVYTGATLATLTEVAPRFVDVSYPEGYYQVTSNTAYYIQVSQNGAANRTFTLNLEAAPALTSPANNAFSARTSLGNAASVNRTEETSVDATTETGEPLPVSSLTATVWYSWTAPTTGAVEIKTVGGANHDTFICAYTGPALATLALQGYNDDKNASAGDYNSSLVLPVTAGVTYQIQVGSAYAASDTFGLTIDPVDSDLLPFRVLSFTASAPAVNLTSASATVTFDVTLSDLVAVESDLSLNLEMPTANAPWGGMISSRFLEGANDPVLVSGTTYRFTRTLPAGLPAGSYPIQVDIANQTSGFANGTPSYGGKDGASLPGGVSALTITNTGTVTTPPVLTGFTMTPSTVDASLGDVLVQISATATGLPAANRIGFELTDTLGIDSFFSPTQLINNGTAWTGSFTIKKGTRAMVYRPTLTLRGTALGRDYGYDNALAAALPAGSTSAFTITNPAGDLMPPQLKDFTVNAPLVNLAAGDVLISGTCRLADQSQVAVFDVGIDNGTTTSFPGILRNRLSGTAQDGVYQWSMVVSHLKVAQSYTLVVFVDDGAGNTLDLATFYTTWPIGFPSSLNVINSPAGGAEVTWMSQQNFTGITGDGLFSATAVNADPDQDGVANLLEFYFGTNPADPGNVTGAANLPVVSRSGNQLRLDFGKAASNLALGTLGSSLIGQYSSDLADWSEVPITATTPGFFRITSPSGSNGIGYLRLKAAPLP